MNTDTCVSAGARVATSAPATTPQRASAAGRAVDLAKIPWNVPWAMLDEHEAAAVLHLSVKVLRRQRHEGVGPRFRKLNGSTVRYRVSDLQEFLDSQPCGGGGVPGEHARRGPGRPRKDAA